MRSHSTYMPLAACVTVAQAASPLYKSPVDIPGLGKVQGVAALNSSVADYVDNWANISFFGGIPFGVSTAGAYRFAPPQPVAPWNITLDASTFGPICPTSNQQISTYPMSEDCLSVNIWTPATSADDKLPVAFWSYGDGTAAPQTQFNGGGVARKGIVFVTYNYRNGVLGFLADPSLPELQAKMTLEERRRAERPIFPLNLGRSKSWILHLLELTNCEAFWKIFWIVGNRVSIQKLNELKGYEKKSHPFLGSVYCCIGEYQQAVPGSLRRANKNSTLEEQYGVTPLNLSPFEHLNN
ncbi:hypothetical protein N7467_010137 [Penicillium canescens]|nr:hypothetical protein N7467_010137 [Penicillium canescens]